MFINNKISRALFGLIALYVSLTVISCNAKSADNGDSTTVKQKYGNHHFTLDGSHMYYNGKPFMLGDSIQNYAKIFGPYYRKCEWNYVWDSLGITLMAKHYNGIIRVEEIKWYLKRVEETREDMSDSCCKAIYNSGFTYFSVPFHVIPEPLEIKECDVDVIPGDKIGKLERGCRWYKGMFPQTYEISAYPTGDTCFFKEMQYSADIAIGYLGEEDIPRKTILFLSATGSKVRNYVEK